MKSLDFSEIIVACALKVGRCIQLIEQVAQRATIAHLTASHQNILNSSQVKDFLIGQGQLTPQSMVGSGQISNSFETI